MPGYDESRRIAADVLGSKALSLQSEYGGERKTYQDR